MKKILFDRGNWIPLGANDGRSDAAHDVMAEGDALTMVCGLWEIDIYHAEREPARAALGCEHVVQVSIAAPDHPQQHACMATILVKDFPSLLELLALIKAGEMQPGGEQP